MFFVGCFFRNDASLLRNTVHIKRIPRLIDGPAVIIEGFDVGIPRQCPSTVGIQAEFLAGFVLIEFQDSKPGVPPEDLEKIFNRFTQIDNKLTNKTKGAGIGLSICKAYSELLGGKITVESIENEGTTFYFTFPKFTFA